jgi:hypothetical protein
VSTLQLVVALVQALAWPLVVLVAVLILRPALVELLGREGLRRLKAGPLEAEWERQISRTEAELDVPPVAPTDLGGLVSDDLGEVARRAPAAAVLEAFARVERELRRVVGPAPAADRRGAVSLARLALERELLPKATVRAVEGMAVLRNLAAHGRGEVLVEQALEYLTLTDGVLFAVTQGGDGD